MPHLSSSFVVLAFGLIAAIEAQATAGPKINSPLSLVQCQPASLSWTDAQPPVYMSAVQGTNTASDPLIRFSPKNTGSGSLTWPAVNITSGITITLVINDATGVNNFSGQVTIKDGSSDCHPVSSSGASGNTAASSTPGASPNGSSSTGLTASTGPTHAATSDASTTSTPVTSKNTTSASSTGSSTKAPTTSTTSTTSGSVGMSSTINTVVFGTAAFAVAGVLLATDLF